MIDMALELLTVEEVAQRLKLSKYTVIRLIHTGQLEYVKLGSRYRVTPEALQEYIIQNTKLKNQ